MPNMRYKDTPGKKKWFCKGIYVLYFSRSFTESTKMLLLFSFLNYLT